MYNLEFKQLNETQYQVNDFDNLFMFIGDLDNALDCYSCWLKGETEQGKVQGTLYVFQVYKDED